ncbi:MAG: hypothetical protein ACI8WP_001652 [Flavobacteriaceae bacterium]|jgi:hypothetical protein
MKSLVIVILAFSLFGCIAEREFVLESDYSYRGRFKKYSSFDFLNLGDTVNYNGLSDGMIKHEIERRLISQGYKRSENPSIYIAYKVFDSSLSFRGYDQIALENWDHLYGDRSENEDDWKNIEEANYVGRNYQMEKGTLLIEFIDSKTNGVIWQGYVSGLFNEQVHLSKDVRYSVRSILNQYRILAANYK